MRTSSISGFTIRVALVMAGCIAFIGYGLFSFDKNIQSPEIAQQIQGELEGKSLRDIFFGTNSTRIKNNELSEQEVIIPAIRMGDHLFVQAELNDYREVTLLVDTGATDIAITSEIAEDLGLMESESNEQMYHTSNGQSQRFVTKLDSIRIGEAVHHNVQTSFGEAKMGNGDGLLGMSFLKYYYVNVDLEREELRLRPREN